MKLIVIRFSLPVRLLILFVSALAGLEAQGPPTMVPPVRGLHEMVAAANNFEVEAGYRILTQGGGRGMAGKTEMSRCSEIRTRELNAPSFCDEAKIANIDPSSN